MSGQIIAAIATASGTAAAGWFAWLAKRAQQRAPESVAGGYSRLVDDMRQELSRVSARVQQLEQERVALQSRVACLDKQLLWLIHRVPDADRNEFDQLFPRRT
jgi:hypothetical protein